MLGKDCACQECCGCHWRKSDEKLHPIKLTALTVWSCDGTPGVPLAEVKVIDRRELWNDRASVDETVMRMILDENKVLDRSCLREIPRSRVTYGGSSLTDIEGN